MIPLEEYINEGNYDAVGRHENGLVRFTSYFRFDVCEFVPIGDSPFAFYCIAVPTVAIDIGGVILPGVREEIEVPAAPGDLGHVTVNMPFKRLAVMSSCCKDMVSESFMA